MQAAFFDLDKTVIARSSVLALGKSFYREGLIGLPNLLRGVYEQLVFVAFGADEDKMERARQAAAELTRGWSEATVRRLVNQAVESTLRPLIYEEALRLFSSHRREGRRVYIVSSAPEEVVGPIARLLKVDDYVATRAEVVDGRYTGEVDFYCYGENKATAIRELAQVRGIDLESSYAYSDSITDLPLLEAVGHPHAVNPDRELSRVAADRGWPVLRFEKTVSLDSPETGIPLARIATAAADLFSVGIAYRLITRRERRV